MTIIKAAFTVVVLALFFSSCSVNKDFMFKTDEEYVFDTPKLDSSHAEFRLAPSDLLSVSVYTKEGEVIFEVTSSREKGIYLYENKNYFLIESDGMVELPVVGKVKAQGLTIQELQTTLEDLFQVRFVNPYCLIKVVNRRVIVFHGNAGVGQVVPLENVNMRLIEAIAASGGLGLRANASKIKVMRKEEGVDKVFLIDLSTIEGLDYANMIVQNGDIIYVESTKNLGKEVLNDTAPVVSILTSVLLLISVFGGL
jgi:polysaccharide export outer membrane protein